MTGEVTIVTNSINDKKIKIGFFTYFVSIMNIYFFPPITMIEKNPTHIERTKSRIL